MRHPLPGSKNSQSRETYRLPHKARALEYVRNINELCTDRTVSEPAPKGGPKQDQTAHDETTRNQFESRSPVRNAMRLPGKPPAKRQAEGTERGQHAGSPAVNADIFSRLFKTHQNY